MKPREERESDKLASGRPASLQKSKVSADDTGFNNFVRLDATRHRDLSRHAVL
jgi:hypothetical protein